MTYSAEEAAKTYFKVWNAHDVTGLKSLFASSVTLRDWDIQASGADKVAAANGNIFSAVPKIAIEVLNVYSSSLADGRQVACCEILVKLNNDAKEVLKVVDVIEFDTQGKILAVRAYKG